jgi:F-type H+-transporting ATPase subunit b
MDATLHALGNLLIQSIPTILFFALLTWYLNAVYFKRMAAVFEERRKATEGVRELAERAFESADRKTSEFERALGEARVEIHHEQEALRRKWQDEQARRLEEARADAERRIEQARMDIAAEADRAQAQLNEQIEALSDQIVHALTRRRAA